MHLVFYDGECGLCDSVVCFLLVHDKKEHFQFAPLKGETARRLLSRFPCTPDTMVLLEEGNALYVEGKAALRTLWLLGGFWSCIGLLYFVTPRFIASGFYRFVARHRHRIFSKESCRVKPGSSNRFPL